MIILTVVKDFVAKMDFQTSRCFIQGQKVVIDAERAHVLKSFILDGSIK